MLEHLYRFNYDIDREQLVKENEIMSASDNTSLLTVNTELIEKVNAGRETGEDIFPTYHDLKDKEQWDNMDTLKIRMFDEYKFQNDCPEMKRLTVDFGNIIGSKDITPFFVHQEKDSDFPFHIDMGFQCAINVIVKGGDTPILFRDNDKIHEYHYENALLNICNIFHSVPVQQDTNRMLLKFRIKDISYEDASKRMMEHFSE
jgi:hypothetical protein